MATPTTPGATGTPQPAGNEAARIAAAAALIPSAERADIVQETVEAKEPAPETKPEEPKQPSPMKSALEEWRAKREAQQAEAQKKATYEEENAQLKQQLEALKSASSFEDDPVAFAKARGWSREEQLTFGKALIYDLAPDQADPNFRVKMLEQAQARREREKAEAEKKQAAEREQVAAREELTRFAQALEAGVMDFDAGSYPESEALYGDDVEGYLRALFEQSVRMAQEAAKKNQVADLTPAAIARELEAATVRRMEARDKRRGARTPTASAVPAASAAPEQKPPAVTTAGPEAELSLDTLSNKDLSGSGAPLPPARSEKERIQRAIAVAFKNR